MPVKATQRLTHDVDRHDAGHDRMLFTQASTQRRIKLLAGNVELVAQLLGRLLELAEIIPVRLDQIANALDGVSLELTALSVGHLGRYQCLTPARLGVGGIEPLQRMRNAGTEFGEIAQFLLW